MSSNSPIDASPTKNFFVEMLTRDIELEDAILDLIDNSLDGVHRLISLNKHKPESKTRPYEGFKAEISFDDGHFSITDNCGGISKAIAISSAFKLGRPKNALNEVENSVGTYGIGMKRAIFKMGRQAEVISRTSDEAFTVDISPEWIEGGSWELELVENKILKPNPGVEIRITELLDPIKNRFSNKSFQEGLISTIKKIYAIIIEKGFSISVNSKNISTEERKIIWDGDGSFTKEGSMAPYVFKGTLSDVDITVVVGFYRPLPTQQEKDEGLEGKYKTDNSGWNIICNERIVLYNDKTRVTGWGTKGIPAYHTQFISIFGIVNFESRNPRNLPVGTTKRSLDLSSDVWTFTLERMKEGLKIFTTYTNKWKEDSEKQKSITKDSLEINPLTITSIVPQDAWTRTRVGSEGKKFIPSLPMPAVSPGKIEIKTIRFTKHINDINKVSQYIFEEIIGDVNNIGEAAFDFILELSKE